MPDVYTHTPFQALRVNCQANLNSGVLRVRLTMEDIEFLKGRELVDSHALGRCASQPIEVIKHVLISLKSDTSHLALCMSGMKILILDNGERPGLLQLPVASRQT